MSHDKKNSRRGRPPLPSDQRRSERVVMMLTCDEIGELRELAEATGQSISSLCHDFVVEALGNDTTDAARSGTIKRLQEQEEDI